MNTFKQIMLGAIMLASMFCSVMFLMMGLYLAGSLLAIICIFCIKIAQKTVQHTNNQNVTDNVSRGTSEENK